MRHRRLLIAVGLACVATLASAQVITTVAGAPWLFQGSGKPAVNAPLGHLHQPVADAAGNVYVSDPDNCIVVKVATTGILTVVAGNGICDFSGDNGPATSASFDHPTGLALDGLGNLYIADVYASRIRKVTPAGVITTIAGSDSGFAGDGGLAVNASLNSPSAVAVDSSGNIYVADAGNLRVRKINSAGMITTYAGTGTRAYTGDNGAATKATFGSIDSLAIDANGNLYVADSDNNVVRKINAAGVITTYAGGGQSTLNNIPANTAQLAAPQGIALDAAGNLYIADTSSQLIYKVSFVGIISTIAGTRTADFSGDGGAPLSAQFTYPTGVAVDTAGNIYIADSGNERLREISATKGTVSTIAGNGMYRFSGDNGPASAANLYGPLGMARDTLGNLYVADAQNRRVRKIAPNGIITTFAGNGLAGHAGDNGPAAQASLSTPAGLATDANGNVYIADIDTYSVRKVNAAGVITTVAGGRGGFSGDNGQATAAALDNPNAVAVDTAGNLYISDSGNDRIRKVTFVGIISTIAGNGNDGFSGDNGQATAATISNPQGLALDAAGNLYFADANNNRIRKVTSSGVITTFVGNGTSGFSGDNGPATSASISLGYPYTSLAFDAQGNLYFTDGNNNRIRKVTPAGIISTVAGGGQLGDGYPATQSFVYTPTGLAFDSAGNMYISDWSLNNVREVLASATSFTLSPTSLTFTVSAGVQGNLTQQVKVTGIVPGLPWSATTTTTSGGGWLALTPATGAIPDVIGVFVNSNGLQPGTYQGNVSVTIPGTNPGTQNVGVTLVVGTAKAATLQVQPGSMTFSAGVGSSTATAQTLSIGNGGAGVLQWTAQAATGSGGNWLTLSSASGAASSDAAGTIQVSASPAGLKAGVYAGSITVKSATTGETVVIQVTLSVLAQTQTILVSQTGLLFTGVDQGASVAPQTFGVLNIGQGTMNWTATASTLKGGNWLSVTPAIGSSVANATTVPLVTVNVDTTGLEFGQYSGQVLVSAPGAPNSPQVVAIFLSVLPEGSNPGVVVRPTGLIFIAPAGGSDPGSQIVQMSTAAANSAQYASSVLTLNGVAWAKSQPAAGTVVSGSGRTLVVQPTLSGLQPGAYRGTLNLLFGDGSPTQNVDLLFVVLPAGSRINPETKRVEAASCTPKQVLALSRTLSNNFMSPAGWPTSLEMQVSDDCGNLLSNATVLASFSNGDAPLALASLGNGTYTATWRPSSLSSQTVVTMQALLPPLAPAKVILQGTVAVNVAVPAVGSGGVVNGASFDRNEVLAPGSIASVFGSSMTTSATTALGATIPLPVTLIGASLTIGGFPAPLFYASNGQINTQIPFELTPNSRPQVVLRTTSAIAVPETITVDVARPGIFLTGTTQGVVTTPANQLVDAAHPASAGDVLIVYCTGLGMTNPVVATNQASPASPAAISVIQPTATVGGVNAPVQFAGLAPGFVGLYQVNVQIPPGVPTTGGTAPLVLTQSGVSSNIVTIGVH